MAFIQTVKQFVTQCFEKCYTSKVVVIIRGTLLLLLEGNAYFCLVLMQPIDMTFNVTTDFAAVVLIKSLKHCIAARINTLY